MRVFGFALIALSSIGYPVTAAETPHPITLECVQKSDHVEIKVVAQAAATEEAVFKLEFSSQGRGGTTTTVQRGSNRIGDAGGTLLQSRVKTEGLNGWTAKLSVTGKSGDYTLHQSM